MEPSGIVDSRSSPQAAARRRVEMNDTVTSPWMTTDEAAAYLKIRPRTLQMWARLGKITACPLSGSKRRVWRFLQADLDGTIVSHSQRAAKERSDAA